MQQTLYAVVVEEVGPLLAWTGLRELRQQWALCRERPERVRRALGKCQLRKRVWDGRQARGDAAWKLAVRAAPIVKPPCFYSMRRLPGTIKMSGLSCFCFVRGSIIFYAKGSGQTRQLLIREEK